MLAASTPLLPLLNSGRSSGLIVVRSDQTHHATNLMERCPSLKLSCENARGLVIERHPGAAAAVDQQSGSDPSGRRARLPRRHRPSGQPVASRRRQRSLLGLAEPGKRARASLNLMLAISKILTTDNPHFETTSFLSRMPRTEF
jgi:hypothetical protein